MRTSNSTERTVTLRGHLIAVITLTTCLAACDGSLKVSGKVTDTQTGKAIAGAEIWMADVVHNKMMKDYLTGKGKLDETFHKSDKNGRYHVRETLAGPGHHVVWLVVRKEGYREKRLKVYDESGFTKPKIIDVRLTPLKPKGRSPVNPRAQ